MHLGKPVFCENIQKPQAGGPGHSGVFCIARHKQRHPRCHAVILPRDCDHALALEAQIHLGSAMAMRQQPVTGAKFGHAHNHARGARRLIGIKNGAPAHGAIGRVVPAFEGLLIPMHAQPLRRHQARNHSQVCTFVV